MSKDLGMNENHEALEIALREALRREDAPAGFAERVMARAASQQAKGAGRPGAPISHLAQALAWWRWIVDRRAWAPALAGGLLLALAAGWYQQQAQQRAEAEARERAKEEALYALRLTSEKLAPARRALAQLGIDLDGNSQPRSSTGSQRQ